MQRTRETLRCKLAQIKRRPCQAALLRFPEKSNTGKLEPVQESSIHAHVVLVADARETEHHPVELDGTENQFVFSEVHAAAEHHGHAAVTDATGPSTSAAKQGVCVGREG